MGDVSTSGLHISEDHMCETMNERRCAVEHDLRDTPRVLIKERSLQTGMQ